MIDELAKSKNSETTDGKHRRGKRLAAASGTTTDR